MTRFPMFLFALLFAGCLAPDAGLTAPEGLSEGLDAAPMTVAASWEPGMSLSRASGSSVRIRISSVTHEAVSGVSWDHTWHRNSPMGNIITHSGSHAGTSFLFVCGGHPKSFVWKRSKHGGFYRHGPTRSYEGDVQFRVTTASGTESLPMFECT